MEQAFKIYLYICAVLVSIIILFGLIGLAFYLIAYVIESAIGFKKFRKILRAYRAKELKINEAIPANVEKAFEKED